MSGEAQLYVDGGDIVVNSASRAAAKTSGKAIVNVTSPGQTKVVGLAMGEGFSPPAVEGADAVADPLAGYPMPDASSLPARSQSGASLQPGVYADQIKVKDGQSLAMAPGVYVLLNGLKLDKGALLTGTGVTIFNTVDNQGKCGPIDLDKGATYSLSAPADGEYRALLIYQDPACSEPLKWAATADSSSTGTIYAPAAEMKVEGDAVTLNTQLIVDRLTLGGAARLDVLFDPNVVARR